MKILKKIIYIILVLFAILCGVVVFFAFNPSLSESLADFLYPESGKNKISTELARQVEGGIGENADIADPLVPEDISGQQAINDNKQIEYVQPDPGEIKVPAEVSGKNGYLAVQDTAEQIEDAAAAELQKQLGFGETGDGLVFDPLFYPYYDMLDENGQHLYRQVYANAMKANAVFAPITDVTAGTMKNVFMAVYNDHPELFWVDTAYSGKYKKNGIFVEINLQFNRTVQNLEASKNVFDTAANAIVVQAQNMADEYEKERYVHDQLLARIEYNLGAEMNQSAYSAIINGQTVCAGYARAFQYLMQQLGIPCYYSTGFAGENHAWNIIELGDEYYNVDTTWDDTGTGTYDYFNKTDADFFGTHVRQDLSVYLPPCSGELYRNLQQVSTTDNGMRSIEDVGITAEQVITNLPDYYSDCTGQILQMGAGNYNFYNVIQGAALGQEWYDAYQTEDYRQGYMENILTNLGVSNCEVQIDIEELQGERYLLTHHISIW